jgi:hypothetical protein
MPKCGLSAKKSPPPKKQSPKINPVVFVLIGADSTLLFHFWSTSLFIWEIIADNLYKAGWSLGWVSAVDCEGRTVWIADAHRDDGRRFVVRADEKLTAFVEL